MSETDLQNYSRYRHHSKSYSYTLRIIVCITAERRRWLQLSDKNNESSDSVDILTSKDSCENVKTEDYSGTL